MQSDEAADSGVGELQYGSYRVVRPLGAGGMSSVYRAVHVETGSPVALKVLPLRMARNPIVLQRFLREARSAESLEHPNIVSIYDRGVDRGRYYLALEYVRGCDLHEFVQRRGPLSVAETIRVIRKVAEGLQYAASKGLIHRDIKPSNILRSQSGEIKITDLGLALQLDLEDERVTREGTTVGTVDYMAPEQARDSRATSLLSDLYSLGCTAYYLLTGVPPYPGGDLTDKLARHARSPAPDARDLRPDVPEALSRILLKMMAKRPEDRFASFDDLITGLVHVAVGAAEDSPGVALVPLDPPDSDSLDREEAVGRRGVDIILDGPESRPASSVPEISLASLPPEEEEHETVFSPAAGADGSRPPSPGLETRRGRAGALALGPAAGRRGLPLSTGAWVGLCVAIGASFLLMIVLIDRLVRAKGTTAATLATAPAAPADRDADEEADPTVLEDVPPPPPGPAPWEATRSPVPVAADVRPRQPEVPPPASRTNPEPPTPQAGPRGPAVYTAEILRTYLPEWALAPTSPPVGEPIVSVRRISGVKDPAIFPTLRPALNGTKGTGTVEIADEGPFAINDLRIPGESRTIRARPGRRAIIRIERPNIDAVRTLPGVFVLENKSLVLDSLDLILNIRDLGATQGSLFSCSGASLTVRNCTITLLNPANQAFTLVSAEGSSARESRILFEKTMVRGLVSSCFDLGKGAIDVAVRESVFLGSQGPTVHVLDPYGRGDQRFSAVGGIFASRGPAFYLDGPAGGEPPSRPAALGVRAFDSIFGRFQGAGIASVVYSETATAAPRERVDWRGEQNLFCGWIGYFASGPEQTLGVPSLSAFRSTWNGSDEASREILAAWPQAQRLDRALPADMAPFIPGREPDLSRAASPRPYLHEKTFWTFPMPSVPVPAVLAAAGPRTANMPMDSRMMRRTYENDASPAFRPMGPPGTQRGSGVPGSNELLFDADAPPWNGDLGAFLREKIGEDLTHARVRVIGSGMKRTSPLRLRDGLILEIRVEPPSKRDAEWLCWQPQAEAQGRALLELRGGAMLLSQVRLRADESASVQCLVAAVDSDLILHRCQWSAPAGAEARTPRLLEFTATGGPARPRAMPTGLFVTEPTSPSCVIAESTLIGRGGGIQATVGDGLVALSQTAVAAGTDAILLEPAPVAGVPFRADLVLDHCTLTSEANVVRLGPWDGPDAGPDRPWLVHSSNTAYLGSYDRRSSDTVLLRVDEEAMSRGVLFWQGGEDADEVDAFAAASDDPTARRGRDVLYHWINLWGANHQAEITGPRTGSNLPSVRLWDRLKPGRIEPQDLILDQSYHPGRPRFDVGADLSLQGIFRRPELAGRRR